MRGGARNPSVRGAKRSLRLRNRHHRRGDHSHNPRGGGLPVEKQALFLAWRLPGEELSHNVDIQRHWSFYGNVFPQGVLCQACNLHWPMEDGDLLIEVDGVPTVGFSVDDWDRFNEVIDAAFERARAGGRSVALHFVRESRPQLGGPLWQFSLVQPGHHPSSSERPQIEGQDNVAEMFESGLSDIASSQWFAAFAEPRTGLLSRAAAVTFLNSCLIRVFPLGNVIVQKWFEQFDSNADGLLTKSEFCNACIETNRRIPDLIRQVLLAWGYDPETLRKHTYSTHAARTLATNAVGSRIRLLCKGSDDSVAMSVLLQEQIFQRIVSNMFCEFSACLVFTIAVEGFVNPESLLNDLAALGSRGTLVDVRRNASRTNFRHKVLGEFCASRSNWQYKQYDYMDASTEGPLKRSHGNIGQLRAFAPPVVMLDESATLIGSARLNLSERLVHYGVADVVHLQVRCTTSKQPERLSCTLHPGSLIGRCLKPSRESAQIFMSALGDEA